MSFITSPQSIWTPAQLTVQPNLWFDTLEPTSITQSNALVSPWQSKVGTSFVDSNGDSYRPTYNGDGITFDDQQRLIGNFTFAPTFHLFIVFKYQEVGSGSLRLFTTAIAPNFDAVSGFVYFYKSGDSFASFISGNQPLSTPVTPNKVTLLECVYSGTTLFHTKDAGVSTSASLNYTNTPSQFGIFSNPNAFNETLRGTVYEILHTPYGLSNSNIARVQGYLAHRNKFVSNLPDNHPYKNDPPLL